MNSLENHDIAKSGISTSNLIDNIKETTEALLIILDAGIEQIAAYGGNVAQKLSGEFVDRLIIALLKLKTHLYKIERETKKGLIKDENDLENIISGLQEIYDQLGTAMIRDGMIRNNVGFMISELRTGIKTLTGRMHIKIS